MAKPGGFLCTAVKMAGNGTFLVMLHTLPQHFAVPLPTSLRSATFPPGEGIGYSAENDARQGDHKMERNEKLTALSQNLRRNQTKEENLLWYHFLRAYPLRFRRQYVIGRYIADFYCHRAKLVVELDGSQHYEPEDIEKDRIRTTYLESLGLCVLRFTNLEVVRQFHAVCGTIDEEARYRAE